MMAVMSAEKVRLVLVLDEEIRAALKLEAAKSGREMSDLGGELLADALADALREIRERRAADEKRRKGGKV